jgi:hypothetical protein
MKKLFALVAALAGLATSPTVQGAAGATPPAGLPSTIYVVSTRAGTAHKGALYALDVTGQRRLLTDFGSSRNRLHGPLTEPSGKEPTDVAVEADGTVLVLDRRAGGRGEVFAVDPTSGARSILTDFGDASEGPTGTAGSLPTDLAVMPDGRILVTDLSNGGGAYGIRCGTLFTVDPGTGRRTILSDFGDPAEGPVLTMFFGLTVDRFGRIYVGVDGSAGFGGVSFVGVVRVDGVTGRRTLVASGDLQNQNGFTGAVEALAAQPDGSLLAAACCEELVRIDPVSHRVTVLSDLNDPALGPEVGSLFANSIALVTQTVSPKLAAGTLLVNSVLGATLTLDLATRERSVFSDFTDPASGPAIALGDGIAGIAFFPGIAPPPPPPPPPPADGTVLTFAGPTPQQTFIYGIDPTTGQRHAISDLTDPSEGPTLAPRGRIAINSAGIVVASGADPSNPDDGLLLLVDPATGARTLLSDFADPSYGPTGFDPFGLAFDTTGGLLVTDRGQGGGGNGAALWRVFADGSRVKLTDFNDPTEGPTGRSPEGVAVDGAGRIYVIDGEAGTDCTGFGDHCGGLFRVDPTGHRTLVSDFGNPAQGPLGDDPVGLALDRDGSFLVIDDFAGTCGCGELFRVDPTTGARTLVSDYGNPAQGPRGSVAPTAVAVALDGSVLTNGCPGASGHGALCRVDRVTGNRTDVGDLGDPSLGPVVFGPRNTLAIYP